jgi:type I restriction enzyme S subunit
VSQLPKGWSRTSVSNLIELKYGKALPDRERSGDGSPVFGSNGIVGYHNKTLTSGPTIIVGRKGSVGEVCFSRDPCSPIDTTYYVDSVPGEQFRYWFYALRAMRLGELNKSTAIPGLSRSDVYPIALSLPPVAEQERIADKLDTVLARVDACRDRLARVAPLLKRFRQSVLAAATSGRLTEEWRDSLKPPDPWRNLELGQFSFVTKLAGFEYTKFVEYDEDGELRVVKAENVGKNGFKHTNFSRVNKQSVQSLTRSKLSGGELIIVFVGAGTGQIGILPPAKDWFLGPNVALIRVDNSAALSAYIEIYIRSHVGQSEVARFAKSTAQPSLSMGSIRSFNIDLPPIDEQTEIVRRVESLFAVADRLETRLTQARSAAERLTPALLAKAFRGELVPQDPEDEPAAELLKRLAAGTLQNSAKRTRRSSTAGAAPAPTVEVPTLRT